MRNLSNATGLSSLNDHVCATTEDGQTYCWGYGDDGQIGNGAASENPLPMHVNFEAFSQVSAGGYRTCAIAPGGQSYCWGMSNRAQTATRSPTAIDTPQALTQIGDAYQIETGTYFSCALSQSPRGIYCWGENSAGQIGPRSIDELRVWDPRKIIFPDL